MAQDSNPTAEMQTNHLKNHRRKYTSKHINKLCNYAQQYNCFWNDTDILHTYTVHTQLVQFPMPSVYPNSTKTQNPYP